MYSKRKSSCVLILALAFVMFRPQYVDGQTRPRAPKPKPVPIAQATPSPTPDVQTNDGVTRAYDASSNVTLVISREALLYDNASEGAVNPLRVTMHLVTSYSGRLSTSGQTVTDPTVKILFSYKYFVPKFDVGDSRDFAIFTGLSTLEASGHLSFVGREDAGRDVITTMQVAIKASEFNKILRSMKAARSVSFFLGRDLFVLTGEHLDLIGKFLAATPHPITDTTQLGPPSSKCDLKIAQAPELRGFRLGESLDDVVRRFPGLQIRRPVRQDSAEYKVDRFFIDVTFGTYYALTLQTPVGSTNLSETWTEVLADSRFFPNFQGVAKLHLEFIDKLMIAIRVEYKDEIKWRDIDEFVTASATALGLSAQWKAGPVLTCDGFKIQAIASLNPSLEMRDTSAESAARQREEELRKKEEDRRKGVFKP